VYSFIQADEKFNEISFLLSNSTTTKLRSFYENISLPDYNNTRFVYSSSRLVLTPNGQIQYFRPGIETKPVYSEPTGLCSVFNVCGKFESCNVQNDRETMCRCLPGFKPAQQDNGTSGYFSSGCLKKLLKCCGKNSDNSADHFLNLKKMKAGRPDNQIPTVNETQCRKKCPNASNCQAYSFKEGQSRAQKGMCYTWSDELDNIQEFAEGGLDLYVQVPLSDIGQFPFGLTVFPSKIICGCGLFTCTLASSF